MNRKQLVAAMRAVLSEEGLVETTTTDHGSERRVFVTTAGKAWPSFGEVASGAGAHLVTPTRTTRGRVPWGSALSSKLALPVLEVRASTSVSTFDVWSAGEKRGQLVLRSGARQQVLDASILAPFVARGRVKGLSSIALDFRTPLASDHQFVAQEIELEAAFPSGSLTGTILNFAAR